MCSAITNILITILFNLKYWKWRVGRIRGVWSQEGTASEKNSLNGGEDPRLGWVRIFNTKERVVVRVLTRV